MKLASGHSHTCLLIFSDGTVRCWGWGKFGVLNPGGSTPVAIQNVSNAIDIDDGYDQTCTVSSDGTVSCWYRSGGLFPLSPRMSGITDWITVSSNKSVCALRSNGVVYCGSEVPGITAAIAIDMGIDHACAVLSNGTIRCWGTNDSGQLGDGTTITPTPFGSSISVAVLGVTSAIAVTNGSGHTCALLSGGSISCWGKNDAGQLGDGSTASSLSPIPVSGITTATAISSEENHTCALLSNGTIKCWGWNKFGQLGFGTNANSSFPITVHGITNAVAVSVGNTHTCAILSDETVKCWGDNSRGQLGDGTTVNSSIPVSVIGF